MNLNMSFHIKNSLTLQHIFPFPYDIPYIQSVITTIYQSYEPYHYFDLSSEVPITIVDQGLILND